MSFLLYNSLMKILSYSDLHLEFDHNWLLPNNLEGDVLVLAGDIITFKNYDPLEKFLSSWSKHILYIPGNHEYYTNSAMDLELQNFIDWAKQSTPNLTVLNNTSTTIDDVHFFGGTMWTDFYGAQKKNMDIARKHMNDFKLIHKSDDSLLSPEDTIILHNSFIEKLDVWLNTFKNKKRVVITHHAPIDNPNAFFTNNDLKPAFISTDIHPLIKKYQPNLWIYGHTHECDDQIMGLTKIISNQLGYPNGLGGFECLGYDQYGKPTDL